MMPTLQFNADAPGPIFREGGPLMRMNTPTGDPLLDAAWVHYALDLAEECQQDDWAAWQWLGWLLLKSWRPS